jgi:DNA-binding NarL/FixJ family response regulator
MTMASSDRQPSAQPQTPNDRAIAVTVVVGDDHQVFLDALSVVLGQRNFAVSVAHTLPEIMDAVACRHPDVCLIDRNFCHHDCPGIIRQVIVASPGTKILVLSADPRAEGVLEALRAGASGYGSSPPDPRPNRARRSASVIKWIT